MNLFPSGRSLHWSERRRPARSDWIAIAGIFILLVTGLLHLEHRLTSIEDRLESLTQVVLGGKR